jgi:hypothetical protein
MPAATFKKNIRIDFMNWPGDSRADGGVSSVYLHIMGKDFMIASDTACYHQLLDHFREKHPDAMREVLNAAPKLR